MNMPRVKKKRRYDSRGRIQQARRNRETIIDAARGEFLTAGYAATTIATIADKAGVSAETIYKVFGGKPGLVRAIYERGLGGSGDVPAYQRSDEAKARETDPIKIVQKWGALASEVSPLVSPILLLVRTAAASEPELAKILATADRQRLARMRDNARTLEERGFLRAGTTAHDAADVMWTLTSPELYELLVRRRGWPPARFGEFIAATLIAALLPQDSSSGGRH